MKLRVIVVVKGHDYDRNAFHAIFDDYADVDATFVEQPAAQVSLRPNEVEAYDAVLFYDMWGISFGPTGLICDAPPSDYAASISALLKRGKGLVLLNHALVQWPAWPLWREISGTTFMLTQSALNGQILPGSGYRGGMGEPHRNATHRLSVVDVAHPVTRGLGEGFEIVDELYLRTPLPKSADILPLLTSDYAFVQENFNPPPLASKEEQQRWQHPRGDNVIVWAKRTGNSPVVASEAGDGPLAYANPSFRKLIHNALHWVASDAARSWARSR